MAKTTPNDFNKLLNRFGKSIIYLIKGHSGKIPISDIHYWANKIERVFLREKCWFDFYYLPFWMKYFSVVLKFIPNLWSDVCILNLYYQHLEYNKFFFNLHVILHFKFSQKNMFFCRMLFLLKVNCVNLWRIHDKV